MSLACTDTGNAAVPVGVRYGLPVGMAVPDGCCPVFVEGLPGFAEIHPTEGDVPRPGHACLSRPED
ncbi:MAG TPA: hypothetical protein RMH99_30470 [Sandaracinaceae bacterium LLY-WYZ-13_1]|nr:hypothetical protein [Sandaracinaceae bacterium LLY-WYZ-13_1]